MSQVYNWQLGRQMEYPYEEHHPDHQFAFVFNTNRCIACQTCTMSCKSTWTFSKGQELMWWNNVETKPYGGYPQNWDSKILKLLDEAHTRAGEEMAWAGKKSDRAVYGQYKGMTIFEAAKRAVNPASQQRVLGYLPAEAEWTAPNIFEDNATPYEGGPFGLSKDGASLPEHKTWFFYLQRICNHCTYAACLAACPRKAIYKRPEDGIVLIDQERCRGYRRCVEACPYKKAMYRPSTRTSEKCVACYPRIEGKDPLCGGAPMETRCMTSCVGQIRLQGLVKVEKDGSWTENKKSPLYHLVKVAKVALPLYPQFGTEPNGFYIPPRWVPREYLKQMFGPGVDEAIENYTIPNRELLAVLQLFRRDQRIIFSYEIEPGEKRFETTIRGKKFELFNDTIIAFGKDRQELFRTTVEEPFHVRPDKHANSI